MRVKTKKDDKLIMPPLFFIFTSGQLPLNSETGEMPSDIKEATKQSLENIKAILEEAGSSLDKVIKVVVFIKDMKAFHQFLNSKVIDLK